MPKEYGSQPGTPASWGPPPLTSRPEGLLASLGIQSGGQYPQHLLPDLQPSYELGAWYREYNQIFARTAIGAGPYSRGNLIDLFTVPVGEVWIVNRIGVYLRCTVTTGVAGTAHTISWQIIRTNNADLTQIPISLPRVLNVYSGSPGFDMYYCLGIEQPAPLILRPSTKVRLLCNGFSGTDTHGLNATDSVANIAYTRCQIGGPA